MKRIAFLLTVLLVLVVALTACGETAEKYTVDFVVNGEVVQTAEYEEGATPTPPTVEDYTTLNMSYTFTGWDKEVVAVTENTTYTAVFSGAIKEFNITFIYGGATEGTPVKVAYGAFPAAPTTGLNYETVEKVYTFAGWDKQINAATADAVYTAKYTAVPQEYDVTFVYGGDKSETVTYKYGETPVAPTKVGDFYHTVEKTYTFKAWDKAIAPVTGDVTYTATYDEAPRSYVITFVVFGQANTTQNLAYGATVTAPTPAATVEKDGKTYTFKGWDKTIATVSGDATYTAVYELPAIYSQNFDGEADFNVDGVTKAFGVWSFTLKAGSSIKSRVDANAPANKFLELSSTANAAAVQIGMKSSTGLAMGDCTKLTISFDLGKKDGVALSDSYIRFRSTDTKYLKFFVTAQADNSITFCGTKLKDSAGNLIALSETLKNFKMEFDFATGKASIAVDGVVLVADADLYGSATGWSTSHGADMSAYIAKCSQYIFQWAVNQKSVATGMLLDNMSIIPHT